MSTTKLGVLFGYQVTSHKGDAAVAGKGGGDRYPSRLIALQRYKSGKSLHVITISHTITSVIFLTQRESDYKNLMIFFLLWIFTTIWSDLFQVRHSVEPNTSYSWNDIYVTLNLAIRNTMGSNCLLYIIQFS